MIMNSFVTIGCLAVLAVTAYADQAYIEQMFAKAKECAIKQGLSDADVEKFMKMEKGDVQTFGCAKACLFKEYNLIPGGGGIDINVANGIIDKMFDDKPDDAAKMKAVAAECSESVKSITEECVLAEEFSDCYHAKIKASGK